MLQCAACGAGATDPMPAELGRYYGETYYGGRHGITDRWCTARRLRWLLGAMKDRRGRLLDVGCGEGRFLAAAQQEGFEVAGVEIGGAAEISRRAGLRVFDSLEAAAGERYDAITAWHSLEHLPDPRAAIRTARRVIEVGGKLLVAVPDAGGVQARLFGARWAHLDPPRHLWHFDARSLPLLLESERFAIEALQHQEIEYDVFGWIQSAQNAVLEPPNLWYASLTGRPSGASRGKTALAWLLGAALGPGALAASLIESRLHRGGTLIAIAAAAE